MVKVNLKTIGKEKNFADLLDVFVKQTRGHCLDTAGVTGSNPVAPTITWHNFHRTILFVHIITFDCCDIVAKIQFVLLKGLGRSHGGSGGGLYNSVIILPNFHVIHR